VLTLFGRPDKKCLSEKCLVQKLRYFIEKASYYVNPIMKSAADIEINSFRSHNWLTADKAMLLAGELAPTSTDVQKPLTNCKSGAS